MREGPSGWMGRYPGILHLIVMATVWFVAVAAEALVKLGPEDIGLKALIKLLDHDNSKVILRALNALTEIGDKAKPALTKIITLTVHQDRYVIRAAHYLIKTLQ